MLCIDGIQNSLLHNGMASVKPSDCYGVSWCLWVCGAASGVRLFVRNIGKFCAQVNKKVKVKCTVVQALRLCSAHRGSRGISGVPTNFVRGGGGSTNSVEDRERGSGGGSPLVRGSGGSCNLVQEISFHIVKFS